MKTDAALRRNLLSRVRMFFYAGAALAQPVWDLLHEVQEAEIGERIVMGTGLGMTESSPFAIFITNPQVKSGHLGLPSPGHGAEAGARRRQDRGPLQGPEHHARLLARAGGHGRVLRRGRLLLHRRRRAVDRRRRPPPGPEVRRPHRRGLQARHRHLRQRRPAAREDHRRRRALRAGRGDHRHQPQRGRRAAVPDAGRAQARRPARRRAAAGRAGERAGAGPLPAGR